MQLHSGKPGLFGDGPHPRVSGWRVQRADVQQAADDGLADAQEVNPRMDEGIVEVKEDDRRHDRPSLSGRDQSAAQGRRVAANQWLDQYAVARLEMVTPAASSAAWTNWLLPM